MSDTNLRLYRILVLVSSTLGVVLLGLPLASLVWRAFTQGMWQERPDAEIVDAIRLSLQTTCAAAVIIAFFGMPLAYVLVRWRFPLRGIVNLLVQLPIVLPPSVAGLALLLAYGRRGVVGPALESVGVTLPFTMWAVIMAQVFVAAPFFIRAAQLGFANIPSEIEDAAMVDGASGFSLFLFVTLPLSWRSLVVGLTLAWTRAMGEFGATILFAGRLRGETETMPLLVYGAFERGDVDGAIWAGIILILITSAALVFTQFLAHQLGRSDASSPLEGMFNGL
jgi:molybdate transport system permease protein